ncbi:eIF3 subunit 6 N terminal domain containing protein [Nitzschia inconspicua]|uniref:Eukaryotic translation initiation factor 3 subunit E n=1 Tax=Nitzschia inconspicua TaxID=303405 RepID=A0A9K3LMB5_9STRA|nr:eIF3 subunit 6 N terminal domain containing protein [Nitzschia inconspicua]
MSGEADTLEQWDLTSKISPFLDRHMMFPLLEYLDGLINAGTISYSSKDVAAARLALLRPTHMVDYAIDIYKSVHGETSPVPQEMEDQKAQVFKQLEELKNGCQPLADLCENPEEKAKYVAAGKWSVTALSQEPDLNITPEVCELYRKSAKFQFECGAYQKARDMLENYISLFAKPPTNTGTEEDEMEDYKGNNKQQNNEKEDVGNANIYYLKSVDAKMLQVLWGRLACEILVEGWEAASVALDAVKAALEIMVAKNQMTPLEALSERTWLLHWSLFVYWNNSAKGGLEQLVELFHNERYKQAITTNTPHLLRYLTAAVLLCKRRITKKAAAGSNAEARRLMKNLTNVMQDCDYSDPIVEFVNCLCVKFDFESAQTKLQECEKVLDADFFLCKQTGLFMEEARVFVFENYCRIHNKIDLSALGKKLAMNENEAERWIVDLIRNADLDAKIDSEEGCVVMGGSYQSTYEQVMERTRDLNVRSATMVQTLQTVLNNARKERAKKAREGME